MNTGIPHGVYRLYGPHDLLMYIGMTANLTARLAVHRSKHKNSWWPLVERHEVEWFPTFWIAQIEEARLLQLHRPMCNAAFPDAKGRHTTVLPGRKPVRSLWDQAAIAAAEHGNTPHDVIVAALRRYVARHRG